MAFKAGIALNISFSLIEVLFGFLSNSVALIADAGHNFSDVLALLFSWTAIRLSQRKPTTKFTYGFRRSTILTAILNTVLLIVAVSFLLWETIQRTGNPQEINSKNVIIVASIGILINSFTAWLFMSYKKHDLNVRSAFIHFVADALVSFGVVVAGIIMALTGSTWIDPVVSFIIIAVILYSAGRLLIDSVSLALDAVPEHIEIEKVRQYLNSLPEVTQIHDLHVWALGTNVSALTVHLETRSETDIGFLKNIQDHLRNSFNIEHSTIQVEYDGRSDACNNCN